MKSRKCPSCLIACVMILHMSRTVGQGHEFLCEAGMTSDDEESASNFLALSMRVSTIHFLGGTVVQVAEGVDPTSHPGSTNDDTGLMVWGPALALSQFLEHNPQMVQGKQVMELGCGAALPSIMARRLGATQVVATDFRQRTLQHVKSNADLNKCVIHTEMLDWEHPAIFHEYAPDIIIASDVLYASSMAPILQKTIEKFLPRNSTFVLATKDGRSGIQDFREAMSKHFDEIQLLTSVNQSYLPQIPESISSDLLSSERWRGTFSIFQYWWS